MAKLVGTCTTRRRPRPTLDKWLQISGSPRKEKRRRNEVRCEVCQSKVSRHLLGKHLVSHYHCRKARSGHPQATRLVLDNIHSVVRQAPFQCSPCKFYCNTEASFKQHWTSQEHERTDSKVLWALSVCFQTLRGSPYFYVRKTCTKINFKEAEQVSLQKDFCLTWVLTAEQHWSTVCVPCVYDNIRRLEFALRYVILQVKSIRIHFNFLFLVFSSFLNFSLSSSL
jgi:hypothetical protein